MPTRNGSISHVHDDVIKWKHFPRYSPFVPGIHRWPVNSPDKGQWRGTLILSLICAWINGWVNNREAGDLRRYRVHYDVTVTEINYQQFLSLMYWRRDKMPFCRGHVLAHFLHLKILIKIARKFFLMVQLTISQAISWSNDEPAHRPHIKISRMDLIPSFVFNI